jgi:hypothetical protein
MDGFTNFLSNRFCDSVILSKKTNLVNAFSGSEVWFHVQTVRMYPKGGLRSSTVDVVEVASDIFYVP